ncbi:MAG: GTP diphosphokinase, partial [Candidatus Baumannia cicadellinicola]|nr:GTP diphosphokinase [Candidatus Baumannia cicadellinicola]
MNKVYRILLQDNFSSLVIQLAKHIAKLRERQNATENKRVLVAQDNTHIYAPLANYLWLSQLKWELEDRVFNYLYPNEYRHIVQLLHERRIAREIYIDNFVRFLRQSMHNAGLEVNQIYGRPKHIYSIWRKMQTKVLAFNELFDLYAVRIVVKQLQDCYTILSLIHDHFNYLPDKFDDYIAYPKPNGYQSIHT